MRRVAQFAAPSPDDARHHYLWRFWPRLPGWGGMAVFDRSWYGRVLVERVEGYASPEQWQRAYGEIVELRDDPLKTWKLTPADWENRRKRSQYLEAIEDMLARTDHDPSPWHLVEAESKKYARVNVVETVIKAHRARDARPADRAAGIRHLNGSCSRPPLECGPPQAANSVRSGLRSPRSTAGSISTQVIPRDSASTRACGLISWAARTPRQRVIPGSSHMRAR